MSETTKKGMTDEERAALAKKLDDELDEFIDGLEKKRYSEGWPEDRWEEEMSKHPFFMTKAPEPGEELSPLMEGLQKLKYDPEENTPEELAENYKEDGNYNFKHKNYRLAIMGYTEGLKIKCNDLNVTATLYNNRAAAHYFLKNYRSSLKDCENAIKLKKDYTKAFIRAANCAFHLSEFDKCFNFCDEILLSDPNNKEILQLRKNAATAKSLHEREKRRKQKLESKIKAEEDKLISEIHKRNIRFEIIENGETSTKIQNVTQLIPQFQELSRHSVHLDDNNLIWPVIFFFPEYRTMDFIQSFNENSQIIENLTELLDPSPEWDKANQYRIETVNVYFENKKTEKKYKINIENTLKTILSSDGFIIYGGVPSFMVFPKDSPAEKKFLANS